MSKNAITPRKPARANGKERYDALLDALESLLLTEPEGDITLAGIAAAAGVPAASVYHFFPTKAAAYVALAETYLTALNETLSRPIFSGSVEKWEDLYDIGAAAGRAYYEAHPAALILLFGTECRYHVRQLDLLNNRKIGENLLDAIDRRFVLPPRSTLLKPFELAVEIHDAVWGASYLNHGRITDEHFREGGRAVKRYLRGYLPEYAERRSPKI